MASEMESYIPNMVTDYGAARCVHRDPPKIVGGAPLRCENYAEEGSLYCAHHQDKALDRNGVLNRAQNRMVSLADKAVDAFERLVDDPDPNVQFKAAEAILNYAGLTKGATIQVEVKHEANTADTIMSKLNDMVSNAAESKAVQSEFFERNGSLDEDDDIIDV